MRATSTANCDPAQREHGAQSCADSFGRRLFDAAMRAVQGFCQRENVKPSYELFLKTGHAVRTCEAFIAGDRVGSLGVAVDLLFTDMGPELLNAWRAEREALGRVVPDWINDLEALSAVAHAMRAQAINKKQAKNLRELNDKL
jgi:hypothetical protein